MLSPVPSRRVEGGWRGGADPEQPRSLCIWFADFSKPPVSRSNSTQDTYKSNKGWGGCYCTCPTYLKPPSQEGVWLPRRGAVLSDQPLYSGLHQECPRKCPLVSVLSISPDGSLLLLSRDCISNSGCTIRNTSGTPVLWSEGQRWSLWHLLSHTWSPWELSALLRTVTTSALPR